MKANSFKNQGLLKQYPFVSNVLSSQMEPFDGDGGVNVDDLTIRIEKADGDLMYRRADNVGLGDGSCIFQMKGNRKDQIMRRGEYLFAIDDQGKIINRVDWPRNDHEKNAIGSNIYGNAILWKTRDRTNYSDPVWDEVEYLVWATVEAWHKDTKNDNISERFGELCDRSVHITIYLKPDCGFEKLSRQSCIEDNLCLDSKIFMQAVFDNNRDIMIISGRLDELCQLFQDNVYFNGMKHIMDQNNSRGMSGQFGVVKVLCAEICGYDRVMLEDAMSWISFQLRPESARMYVLGMNGTLPQLRKLVKNVVEIWNEKLECRANFVPDRNVSIL
ncbi:MAG: hypothetical protein WC863_00330 [Patescibacteria group bacterium]